MYEKKTNDEDLALEDSLNTQNADFENLKNETILMDAQMFPTPESAKVVDEVIANTEIELKDDIFENKGTSAELRLWGDILLKVKQSGDNILGAICETIDKTKINGDNFEIYLHSNSFDNIEYYNKMQKIIRELTNLNLKVCNYDNKNMKIDKDIEYLKQKFGEKLSII